MNSLCVMELIKVRFFKESPFFPTGVAQCVPGDGNIICMNLSGQLLYLICIESNTDLSNNIYHNSRNYINILQT